MAGKRLQMTFVTSEIWLRLLLAANGCSSHVTTSECTREGKGEERRGREGDGDGRGRELRFICETRTHPTASPLRWGSEGKGRRNTKGERAAVDGEWRLSQ